MNIYKIFIISSIIVTSDAFSLATVETYQRNKTKNTLSIVGDIKYLSSGMAIQTYRKTPTALIQTGSGYIQDVLQDRVIAVITEEETFSSKTQLQPYPGIMSGDYVHPKKQTITPSQLIIPKVSIQYSKLFLDPRRTPQSYEISEDGEEVLKQTLKEFSKYRIGTLLVKGFTDDQGTPDENQIESYQRALTIRQFLIEEMGFDPNRVVALGFGELEHKDVSQVGHHRARNRRITFSIVRGSTSCLNCQKLKPSQEA